MRKGKLVLLDKIKSFGRLLTDEEIIDHYIEYHSRGTCHTIVTINGLKTLEDNLCRVSEKAKLTYFYTLGRLVASGDLNIKFDD